MTITVELPDGSEVDVDTDDPHVAAHAASAHFAGQKQAAPRSAAHDTIHSVINSLRQFGAGVSHLAPQVAAGAVGDTLGIPGGIRSAAGIQNTPDSMAQRAEAAHKGFWPAVQEGFQHAIVDPIAGIPTSHEINEGAGLPTEATTVPEQYARTAGQFLPGALLPGSALTRIAGRVAAPAIASEFAGQETKGGPLEPWARFAGGLLGGGVGEAAGALATKGASLIGGAETLPQMAGRNFSPSRLDFAPNQVNSLGAGIRIRPAAAKPAPDAPISRTLAALAERSGGMEGMKARTAPYEEAGVTPRVFQSLGVAGVRRADTLAGSPGRTPDLARGVIDETLEGLPSRAGAATDEAFGASPRDAAAAELAKKKDALRPQYNTLLDKPMPQTTWDATIAPILKRVDDAGYLQETVKEARANAALRGIDYDKISKGRQAQEVHQTLGDAIGEAVKAGKTKKVAALTIAKKDLEGAFEQAVPGIKELNAKWADASQAQKLLGEAGESSGWASDFFSTTGKGRNASEIKAQYEAMTPLQKDAALTSLRHHILMEVGKRSDDGAGGVLVGPFLKDIVKERVNAILPPEKATSFIRSLRLVKNDAADMGAIHPYKYGAYKGAIDSADMLAAALKPVAAATDFVTKNTLGKLIDPHIENYRNKLGAELFSPLTPEFQQALEANLAKRSAQRAGRRRGLLGSTAESAGASQR